MRPGFNNKARLLAGHASRNGETGLYAGLTSPCRRAGRPIGAHQVTQAAFRPIFDWQGSDNLASATVLYPAPHRLHDKAGDVVGYKDGVLFPVLLKPKDVSKPVTLHGKVSYGVCKDICTRPGRPADCHPPDVGTSDELTEVLDHVPVAHPRAGIDPVLSAWRLDQSSGKPSLC